MLMIVLIPIWNCAIMLHDETFLFFVGEDLPWGLIVLLICTVILFMLTTVIFYLMGRGTPQLTEKQTLSVFTTFTTLLAVVLLTYSQSMRSRESALTHDLLSCRLHNPHVMQLSTKYQDLHDLRSEAVCATESSVEMCEGFGDDRESNVLRSMENSLVCSGFCINTPRGISARERAAISQSAAGSSVEDPGTVSAEEESVSFEASAEPTVADELSMQGMFLVLVAAATSLLTLVDGCTRKQRNQIYKDFDGGLIAGTVED